jgi:MFS family permease
MVSLLLAGVMLLSGNLQSQGWRYVWYGNGAFIFVLSVLRVTVIRLKETPKYLLAKGQDQEVVNNFQSIAHKYNRPCSLTIQQLDACGPIKSTYGNSRYGVGELMAHLRGLFATKKMGISTSLIWFSWTLIGMSKLWLLPRSTLIARQVSPTHCSTSSCHNISPVGVPRPASLVRTMFGEIT